MSLVQEIEETQSFKHSADVLCWRLGIPGLQFVDVLQSIEECDVHFPRIWKSLEDLWGQGGPRVKGTICVMFGRLSMDPAIRSKLADKGAIRMVAGLLKTPELQFVALRALIIMTCHSGTEQPILYTINKSFVRTVVEIAKSCKSDSDPIFTYCTCILAQTSFAAFGVEPAGALKAPPSEQPNDEDAKSVFALISRACKLRYLNSARQCFAALLSISRAAGSLISKSPEALKCLVGHLRDPDMAMRMHTFISIHNIYNSNPQEPTGIDPQRAFNAIPTLREDAEYMGMYRDPRASALYSMVETQRGFSAAMEQNLQDRNMLALGVRLYRLLMSSEWAIPYGYFPDKDGKINTNTGLPYVYFYDALPHCSKALRAIDPKSEAATILDIKYEILNRRYANGHQIAENWIKTSNPNASYCYYALSLSQDNETGLKWAKKGLRTNPKGYLKPGLLSNAIDYAASLAADRLDTLHTTPRGSKTTKVNNHAIAYLQSALKDSEEYIKYASLDARELRGIMAKYMGLYVAFKGPKIVSPDLAVLQPLISKFATAERFSSIVWSPVIDTPNRATWKLVEEHYPSVAKEWDEVFESFEKKPNTQDPPEGAAADGLENLLHSLYKPDKPSSESDSQLDERKLQTLMCSECEVPSAQLKKCGRCGEVRYCDPGCQKRAWPTHKLACGVGSGAASKTD